VASKRVDLAYNADGQYTSLSGYADTTGTNLVATSTFGYNGVGALTSLSYDKGGTNFAAYTYGYDHMMRLTSTSSNDGTDAYTYDAASQITAATHSYQTNESYSYDANGNRTNTGYSTGTNNQLSSDGTYNYTYDNEGNLTQKTAISGGAYTTFTWDYHNRLTDVQNYTSSNVLTKHVHYTYDVYDRLIGKQLDPTGGGTYSTTQRFAYDGNNLILAFNGSGTITDRLLAGVPASAGGGAAPTLADEKSGTVNWYFVDNLGTVRDVAQYNSGTNTTSVVDHLKFDSFGNITGQSNPANQPLFAFTGQVFDSDSGLYWYHARWYDPHTGRFISQDPSGFAGRDANLYRYVLNSPVFLVDPTGLRVADADGNWDKWSPLDLDGIDAELVPFMQRYTAPVPSRWSISPGPPMEWWEEAIGETVGYDKLNRITSSQNPHMRVKTLVLDPISEELGDISYEMVGKHRGDPPPVHDQHDADIDDDMTRMAARQIPYLAFAFAPAIGSGMQEGYWKPMTELPGWQEFLPQAEARLAAARATYGSAGDTMTMAVSRKTAIARLEGLAPQVEEHLAEIAAEPESQCVLHWTKEIETFMNQMNDMLPHVGKKTAQEWMAKIEGYKSALGGK
jgi:RHS repeat-associated protein